MDPERLAAATLAYGRGVELLDARQYVQCVGPFRLATRQALRAL